MVSSSIDIASQALGLLRANTISSFTDGSNEAEVADLYYEDFAQDILTRYQWSFALKKSQFNGTTAPLNEWRYAHIVPPEALRIWAIFRSTDVLIKPLNEYEIVAPTQGREVHSNYERIYGEYTVYTDEANWPGYFTHFAVYAFAALIALPVTDDANLAQQMHQMAWGTPSEGEKGGKFAVATGIDAQQMPPHRIVDTPFVTARFS